MRFGHVVFNPAAAARREVLHRGLEPVERFRKAGCGGLIGFELFPRRAKIVAQVVGKDAKDTISGKLFLRFHIGSVVAAENRVVACVNLYQIMQDQHLDDAGDVDIGARLIRQHQRIKRQVPAMFSRVFGPRRIAKQRPACDRLELVRFVQKGDLLLKSGGHTSAFLCTVRSKRLGHKVTPLCGGKPRADRRDKGFFHRLRRRAQNSSDFHKKPLLSGFALDRQTFFGHLVGQFDDCRIRH